MNENKHGDRDTSVSRGQDRRDRFANRGQLRVPRDQRALARLTGLCERVNHRFLQESWRWRMREFRKKPASFAHDILDSDWWDRQEDVARALVKYRRVAVKSANGVSKTYLAADLALWFLYSHQPAIVLTTAPTWRQVRHVLWQEIRQRHRKARVKLPGRVLTTRLDAEDGWFALGLATTEADRFQGFHAENLLIIFEEASGIPNAIWDATEGIAVAGNNKILAIGNPLATTGRFYRIFQRANSWHKMTITALEHPNLTGIGSFIPGAVTSQAVNDRIDDWCEPVPESPITPAVEVKEPSSPDGIDTFVWDGRTYRPNNLFRARVLGQFPAADDESLIPLRWIESALQRSANSPLLTPPLPSRGRGPGGEGSASRLRLAADVARFGDDSTVIGWRVGQELQNMEVMQGSDLMQTAGRIRNLAYELHPESIIVDAIGLGAGVVDRLTEMQVEGVIPMNVSLPAHDPERFANRRAELYWGLRERFRLGEIALSRLLDSDRLAEELASIKYRITSRGQIQIESKDQMKKRGQGSPDRADMLAMLYDSSMEWLGVSPETQRISLSGPPELGPAARFRSEMRGW